MKLGKPLGRELAYILTARVEFNDYKLLDQLSGTLELNIDEKINFELNEKFYWNLESLIAQNLKDSSISDED